MQIERRLYRQNWYSPVRSKCRHLADSANHWSPRHTSPSLLPGMFATVFRRAARLRWRRFLSRLRLVPWTRRGGCRGLQRLGSTDGRHYMLQVLPRSTAMNGRKPLVDMIQLTPKGNLWGDFSLGDGGEISRTTKDAKCKNSERFNGLEIVCPLAAALSNVKLIYVNMIVTMMTPIITTTLMIMTTKTTTETWQQQIIMHCVLNTFSFQFKS